MIQLSGPSSSVMPCRRKRPAHACRCTEPTSHAMDPPPSSLIKCIEPYLPHNRYQNLTRPFVTLTYAQLLDSRIAAQPGTQTKISGPETKSMTHFIRSCHDAILVGIGTVLADDPKLNCRHPGGSSPRPIVLDPCGKWKYADSQLCQLAENSRLNNTSAPALAPYIVVDSQTAIDQKTEETLQLQGGRYVRLALQRDRLQNWKVVLAELQKLGIKSLMVEGGAQVINDLLRLQEQERFVDSLIVTIGPVFLGLAGVEVSPLNGVVPRSVRWWSEGDAVMCGMFGEDRS